MNSRERVAAALDHKDPDRVPIDLGGAVSGIHSKAYEKLIRHMGLNLEVKIYPKDVQQLARLDDVVLERLGVDFRHVSLRRVSSVEADRLDDSSGRPYFIDEWGIKWARNLYYYDMVDHPLKDASIDSLESYDWPDPKDPERYVGLRDEVKRLYYETDYAIQADAFFGGIYECAWWLRGFENFTVDMYRRQHFAETFLDKITDLYIEFYSRYLDEIGDYVQLVDYNDDIGMQTGPLITPSMFTKYLKPRYTKLYKLIHSKTRAKVFQHSCGAVYPFIPDLIEMGLDVLNPVQPLAAKMEISGLKHEFGDRLSFHGGIDIQRLLPYGTMDEVSDEVKRVTDVAGRGGGYILAGAHNIQVDTPPENILTLFDAAKRHGINPSKS